MTKKRYSRLLLAIALPGLALAGSAAGGTGRTAVLAQVQRAEADPLWHAFYRSIAGFLNTGGDRPNQGATILSLEPASLVVDLFATRLDDGDASVLADFVDRLTEGHDRREDTGITFSRLYQDILRFARMPERQNDPPANPQMEALRLLYVDGEPAKGPTALFARYTSLKQALEALLMEAQAESSPTLAARITATRQRLETLGRQHEVESALSRIHQAQRSNAVAAAGARFRQFAGDPSRPQVRSLPPLAEWDDDGGWTRVSFAIQPDAVMDIVAPSPLMVSLEIKRVLLDRNWLDMGFLGSPWVWKADTPVALRNRLPRPPAADGSPRLCLATQLILARNVSLSGWSRGDARRLHAAVRKAAGFQFGPITLKGTYGLPAGPSTFAPRPRSQGLFSPELHVLGQVCQLL